MKLLEEKILKDGKIGAGNVLKVDSFVNHQVDVKFMNEVGKEFHRLFGGCGVDKILTIEASGIGIACLTAQYFDVPVVFAKKTKTNNIAGDVYIHKTAKVAPSASINGPCIIDAGAEVRHCAFVRGNAIVGKNSVVGNSTELKNVVLFDNVQVPHYNYVGDSVLGYKSHMGAGSIASNLKSDKSLVCVNVNGSKVPTGLKKFGIILGDKVEVGCGSVLNPGTVIGRNTNVYPLSAVRGYIPKNSIYKKAGEIAEKR